jgi:hypothetical protein
MKSKNSSHLVTEDEARPSDEPKTLERTQSGCFSCGETLAQFGVCQVAALAPIEDRYGHSRQSHLVPSHRGPGTARKMGIHSVRQYNADSSLCAQILRAGPIHRVDN